MGTSRNILDWLRFKAWAPWRLDRFESYYLSHSQFGEDMVLRSLWREGRPGTYVDIGAHHPVFYSNTYHFYRNGWRGLNVDAIPGSMDSFRLLRPRDVNVECCVGVTPGQSVDFYMFEDAAINTLDPVQAEAAKARGHRLLGQQRMVTQTVNELVARHLPGREIDLLCMDIEGMDLSIVRSIDWQAFRPKLVVVEDDSPDLASAAASEMSCTLKSAGYTVVAKAGLSLIALAEG